MSIQLGHRNATAWNVSAWAISNPAPTYVLFLLLALLGIWSLPALRINNTPDTTTPTIMITVAMPGAAPSEIETLVTRRVEDAVARLGGIRRTTSTSVPGSSQTVAEFSPGTDVVQAASDIHAQMGQIRSELPAGAREPVVARVDAAGGAILTYAVSSDRMSVEAVSARGRQRGPRRASS
jgi:multidrug efflux pump subunit AcrB